MDCFDDDGVFCACDDDGVVDACNDTFATNDDEEFPTDAQIALAQRAVYVRHRRNLALTRITTIVMIKHEEAEVEAEAARGSLADKDSFADEGVGDDEEFTTDPQLALALRAVYARHHHDLHTLTRQTLAQETETELGGADLSTRRRVIKATIALIKLATAKAEAARGRYAGDKPTTPGIDDGARGDFAVDVATGRGVPRDGVQPTGGARTGSVIVEMSVDGWPGGDGIADDDGELDIKLDVEEAVQQDSFVAPREYGGASAAPAAAAVGLRPQFRPPMIGDEFHAERSVDTDVSTHREEPSSPPSPDGASTIGRSYDDITKTPPPYLRCVVSSLSSQSPILRCTAASLPRFCWSPTFRC